MITIGTLLTLSGTFGTTASSCIFLRALYMRNRYRKNISLDIMNDKHGKYVIRRKIEKFNHVMVYNYTPQYFDTKNETIDNTKVTADISHSFLHHDLPQSYVINANKLFWLYDRACKIEASMSCEEAIEKLKTEYGRDIHLSSRVVHIKKYEINGDIYFFGKNDNDKFTVEGVGTDLKFLNEAVSLNSIRGSIIFFMILFFAGMIIRDVFV